MSIYRELAYDRVVSRIKGIQFCVMSDAEIRRRSVCEVTENSAFSGNEPTPNGLFDLRMGACIQFGASALLCLPFMFLFETREVHWTAQMIGALVWSVLALSIGAISLLFVLIRKGAATKVTSLLYLTPPTTAVMAWALFGERFPPLAALGMVIAACGVALVIRK